MFCRATSKWFLDSVCKPKGTAMSSAKSVKKKCRGTGGWFLRRAVLGQGGGEGGTTHFPIKTSIEGPVTVADVHCGAPPVASPVPQNPISLPQLGNVMPKKLSVLTKKWADSEWTTLWKRVISHFWATV